MGFVSKRLYWTALVLVGALVPSATAGTCLPPYPVGDKGGGYCGPQELSVVGLVDVWAFRFVAGSICYRGGWFPYPCIRTRVDEVNFAPVCQVHDSCYRQLSADPTNCDEKIANCNDAFNAAIRQRCDQLPNGCQRSRCHNVVAKTFSDLVEAAEDYFKAAAGCVS
jgi:hypothetical protein